ncbi:MAG: hypothetical protein A2W33_06145 [Chloroflexi bacterium RBG_16_52_11]|nr:MAG: hypothetical protein A2W33_06145 [Chloroflexi bacterium RBG_16_52_11]
MSSEVIAALIAVVVSVIGSGITLLIGLRNIRLEREKLRSDRERLQPELRHNAEQSRRDQVEIAKLRAETEKLLTETNEIRQQRIVAERNEIRDFLGFFERAVFDAPMLSEEPVEMFKAIQQTRISLQMSRATLISDHEIAEHFRNIREILLRTEGEVQSRFPIVAQTATQYDDRSLFFQDRREEVHKKLGPKYFEPVRIMMNIRPAIKQHLQAVHERLRELDAKINEPVGRVYYPKWCRQTKPRLYLTSLRLRLGAQVDYAIERNSSTKRCMKATL